LAILFLAALLIVVFPEPFASSGTVDGIRADLSAVRSRMFEWRSGSLIAEYVRTHQSRRLQIGAGTNAKHGWLNTDIDEHSGIAYLDATRRFPLEDASFDYVYSEHVIEHLSDEQGQTMLSESFRILRPGGKVRIATPNLRRFLALFDGEDSDEVRRYIQYKLAWHGWPDSPNRACTILNREMSSFGHRFLYDPETLGARLTSAGFTAIQQFVVGDSDDESLRGLESRGPLGFEHVNAYETMVLQAVKPQG
jgi:predicted SAM-dependent methyltransferase